MKTIDNIKLKEMFVGGYKNLLAHKAEVDALNVFPVPDGDTGTNMSLTLGSAVKEIEATEGDCSQLLTEFARGALKGARGNSGVILSQIIKGLARYLGDEPQITTKAFAKALSSAREVAYSAVTKPKEGTVLTVIRSMAEHAPAIANKNSSFITFFEALLAKGEETLQKTPEMLPVLKKAGVVDAGGRGLLYVFQGFYLALAGKEIEETPTDAQPVQPVLTQLDTVGSDEHDLDNIKYAYCTEYFIINLKKHITEEDIEKLRDKLMTIGDCVIVIGDVNLVKVHVHTNSPNKALYYALQLGELDKIKIENMLEQHRALVRTREANKKPLGMVAICAGEGFASLFRELTVDEIVEGGQTMNPSVDDILHAVEKVNADSVIVLPNNKNIIMAAERVAELTEKHCYVLPTAEVAEGISAAVVFDPSLSAEANVEQMKEAFERVNCGEVTCAVRKTELDGFSIKIGDYIGLDSKKIVSHSKTLDKAVLGLVDKLVGKDSEVITLYYGADVSKEDSERMTEAIEEKYPDCDVVCYYGGQPHYFYMISVE